MSFKRGDQEQSVFVEDFSPMEKLANILFTQKGINLCGLEERFLSRRIMKRVAELGLDGMDTYAHFVEEDLQEAVVLFDSLGIQVTRFFRNPEIFNLLESIILPEIVLKRNVDEKGELRIWSAGCASGEEPYSMAMLAEEGVSSRNLGFFVFGTDINSSALADASKAEYGRDALLDTRLRLIDTYFEQQGDSYYLQKGVKENVHFSIADLTSTDEFLPRESIFNTYDIILCRNVLIYYRDSARRRALDNLCEALSHGGWLVLGSAEYLSGDYASLFKQPFGNMPIYKKL